MESHKKYRAKAKNKIKNKIRCKNWRLENLDKSRFNALRAYNKVRKIIEDVKNRPCKDCKKSYPHYVMDFDHVRGKKLFNIGRSRSVLKTIKEIKKCDIVCANCHRIRTWKNKKRVKVNVSNKDKSKKYK